MDLEAGRHGRDPLGEPLQLGERQRGVGGIGPLLAEERIPVDRVLALVVGEHRVVAALAGVERGARRLDHLVGAVGRQDALRDQLVAVELARSRVRRDLLVHQRLRHRRRVLLVVAELRKQTMSTTTSLLNSCR
jgi:hypothetical protein